MGMFPNALKKGHWKVAALCLLIGMLRVAMRLSREALLKLVRAARPANASERRSHVGRR